MEFHLGVLPLQHLECKYILRGKTKSESLAGRSIRHKNYCKEEEKKTVVAVREQTN